MRVSIHHRVLSNSNNNFNFIQSLESDALAAWQSSTNKRNVQFWKQIPTNYGQYLHFFP